MRLLTHIALSGIWRNIKRNIYPAIAILSSMAIVSFFALFIYGINDFLANNRGYSDLPIEKFLNDTISSMISASLFLIILTLVSIYVYCGTRREDTARSLAVLTSVGATKGQKTVIRLIELSFLYVLPIVIGTAIGIFPAILSSDKLILTFAITGTIRHDAASITVIGVSVALLGIISIFICEALLSVSKERSLIQAIRRHNKRESEQRRSYRNLYSFKSMPITARLAKKSVDYHSGAYMRIALMFSVVTLYPIIAFSFFKFILGEQITLDENPYDGIDTAEQVLGTVSEMLIFLFFVFAVLCVVGVLQLIYMIKLQNNKRRASFPLYTSVGMTEEEFKRVLRSEHKAVFGKAIILTFFMALLVLFI